MIGTKTIARPRAGGDRKLVTGNVFDIQRFALHDGPGIRTTVFLKGCPLRCIWCHNPESMAVQPELSVDIHARDYPPDLPSVCPRDAIRLHDGRIEIDRSLCDACGLCVPSARPGAIRVVGTRMGVDDVMNTVLKDRSYYRATGGGITLSGGEPMAQFAFARALLRRASEEGLHTCLDTSGATLREYLQEIIDDVDLFLYDYKASDPVLHRRLTGVENDIVLSNLDYLYHRGAAIRLRCPLVPGVNDSPDHLEAIAALDRKYPALEGIEILPYHDMGRDKAARVGRKPAMAPVPAASEEHRQSWISYLRAAGCDRPYIGDA